MPGDQVADRAVGANPEAAGRERVGELIAEPAQHLELEVAILAAGQPVVGDRVRHRAQVVRGDRDPDGRSGVEQPAR